MKPVFRRSPENPILTVQDMPFSAEAVLNPGAAEQGGDVALLLRGDELWIYHGAADTCVCMAFLKLKDVLGSLVSAGQPSQ